MYVPAKLVVSGNATATADNIRSCEWLLRIGIASELIHQIIAVFLVLALYRLLKAVNEAHGKQVVILGALVSVPIMFVNVLNEIAALVFLGGAGFLSLFEKTRTRCPSVTIPRPARPGHHCGLDLLGAVAVPVRHVGHSLGLHPARVRRAANDRRGRPRGQLLRHAGPATARTTGLASGGAARACGGADHLLAFDLGRDDETRCRLRRVEIPRVRFVAALLSKHVV